MKVYSYYSTDPEGQYFSMYVEPIEVADEAEAETIGNALVTSAKSQACVTAAFWSFKGPLAGLEDAQ
jgi:hypothetical protein